MSKATAYKILLGMQAILLIIDIYLPVRFDFARLRATDIVNISFDWIAMLSMMVIFFSCLQGRKTNNSDVFLMFVQFIYLCIFSEVGTWSVDGIGSLRKLNYFFNISCNSMMLLSTYMYYRYVCATLEIDISDKVMNIIKRVVQIATIVGIVAEIVNYKFVMFYYIDHYGNYAREPLGSLIGYIPFLVILICSSYIILKNKVDMAIKITYLSYTIVPFVVSIWYTITGLPPTFFVSLYMSLLLIYSNIHINQGREAELFMADNAKKEAELALSHNQLMLSQIKPHFLYNSLGSIEQLCTMDADKAKEAVHHFAKYLRANMDSINKKELIPFSQELEHIRNYMWLELMRFEDDLIFKEDILIDTFSLPPLSIQPLVENAVKHGMMSKETGVLTVILSTRETEKYIEIKISDDGGGFDVNEKKDDGRSHVGLENVKDAIKMRCHGELMIESTIGKGTIVTVHIPK